MAKAQFVKEAKKPIYQYGKRVEYVSKRGKREGQTLSKIDRSQPRDENDKIIINVGDSYWTWCFYGGQPHYSRDAPRQSQLTQNWFKSELYSIAESVDDLDVNDPEELAAFIEELSSQIESLRDECQERFDNIPEQLQEGDAAQTIQERIDALESLQSDIDSIDTDFCSEKDDEERDTMSDEEWEKELEEEREQWCQDKIEELQGFDFWFE